MSKYQNGKIYKIVDNTNDNVYIGSTINKLNVRLSKHETDWRLHNRGLFRNNRKVYDILKNNDYRIELIKEYPCNSKEELCWEEGYYQMTMPCINTRVAGYKAKQMRRIHFEKFL